MPMTNQFAVCVRLRGVVRQEEDAWIAGFPRLDVYSQGNSAEEAKVNASAALRLWVDSCIDRGTLADALRELGWHRAPAGQVLDAQQDEVRELDRHIEDSLGEPWVAQIEIPAYQTADLLAADS